MVWTFIGGVVPIFLSLSTIVLIFLTYETNRQELIKLNQFNTRQLYESTFSSLFNSIEDIIINHQDKLKRYLDGVKNSISDPLNRHKFEPLQTNEEIERVPDNLLIKRVKDHNFYI